MVEESAAGGLDAHDGGATQSLVEERDGDDRAVAEFSHRVNPQLEARVMRHFW